MDNFIIRLKVCLAVLRKESVIFNVEIYGKVKIRLKKGLKLFTQDCKFLDPLITDKVVVLPDDLKMPEEEREEEEILSGKPL